MLASYSPKALLLRIVILLPVCFFIWYYCAPILLWPVYLLAQFLFTSFFPRAIELFELITIHLEVITYFPSSWLNRETSAGQDLGQIVLTVNALKYGYSLPLFCAMVLSVPGSIKSKIKSICLGYLILLIVQVWGVSFEILKTATFQVGEAIYWQQTAESAGNLNTFCQFMNEVGCGEVSRNIIALGYQLGYLILPAISPLIVWSYFHFDYLQKFSPKIGVISGSKSTDKPQANSRRNKPKKKKRKRR